MLLFLMSNASNRANAAVTPLNPDAGVARSVDVSAAVKTKHVIAASANRLLIRMNLLRPTMPAARARRQRAKGRRRRMPSNAVESRCLGTGRSDDARRPPGFLERDRRLPQA